MKLAFPQLLPNDLFCFLFASLSHVYFFLVTQKMARFVQLLASLWASPPSKYSLWQEVLMSFDDGAAIS